jgi:hypothetical protein
LNDFWSITALHRCVPPEFVSSYFEEVEWIKYAPFDSLRVLADVSGFRQVKEICALYGEVLAIQYISKLEPGHPVNEVKDLIQRAMPVLESYKAPIFSSLVGHNFR